MNALRFVLLLLIPAPILAQVAPSCDVSPRLLLVTVAMTRTFTDADTDADDDGYYNGETQYLILDRCLIVTISDTEQYGASSVVLLHIVIEGAATWQQLWLRETPQRLCEAMLDCTDLHHLASTPLNGLGLPGRP